MILQVLSDARAVGDNLDPERTQRRRRSNAGEHEKMRRADRARAENNFARGLRLDHLAVMRIEGTSRAVALEGDPMHQAIGLDAKIGATQRRAQERVRGTAARAVALCHVRQSDAVLCRPVDIVVALQAELLAPRDECCSEWVRRTQARHMQTSVMPMEGRIAADTCELFAALEIGQYIVEAPALVAKLTPLVVVIAMTAHIHHRV